MHIKLILEGSRFTASTQKSFAPVVGNGPDNGPRYIVGSAALEAHFMGATHKLDI